ncbi:MAG: ABC transporter ATP-binding protein, partial [Gammaproteobacteria bacterium]|nr:ABC transporter ATP-binding protein [Gammaproteobacteria bacterium]
MSLLDVNGLGVRYADKDVVSGLSFGVGSGESVGLVGESGSGKTQTALAIMGLLPSKAAISGSIDFAGTEIVGASERQLNTLRAERIGMVFQDPMQALNPYVPIGKQLRRVLLRHGISDGREVDQRVMHMLDRVGLPDPARQFRAYAHQLSGGMRQRVMIASALLAQPDLLIADEPTTALDVTVQAQILELLERIREETALLLITHDLGIIAGHCERLVVIEAGRLVEEGPTRKL